MKENGVKKIYKTPAAVIFTACGNAVLAASNDLSSYDAEVSDTSWFGNNGGSL